MNLDNFITADSTYHLSEGHYYHALNNYHEHPEMEFLYIKEGLGSLLINNTVHEVQSGQFIIVGRNVPHMFKFEKHTYQNPLMKQGQVNLPLKLLTLHFDPEVTGRSFLRLPENALFNQLAEQAAKGIVMYGDTKKLIIDTMYSIPNAPAHRQLLLILELLTEAALSTEKSFLSDAPKNITQTIEDEKRLTKVYLYTLNNFKRTIKLKEIADIVYMVPNAFCRFFKLRTNKSYFEFLMEIRIKQACKLLKEEDYSVVIVCYESGFSNLSNFNRHFKQITGKTPLEYRKSAHFNVAQSF